MGGLRGEEKWRPDRIGVPEAREIRRSRQEAPSGRRGAEGIFPAHLDTGSLLSSQADLLSSKDPSNLHGSLAWESRRGRWGHLGEAGEERSAFALLAQAQEGSGAPR